MKITLITCTYNAEKYIERTVNSVLMQTYRDIEHIIIDGNSKDNTINIANIYKKVSDNTRTRHEIIITSEPDNGLYDAMNKGINKATGDYLCFLNAGDVLPDNNTISDIAKAVSNAIADDNTKQKEFSVLYGETDIVDGEGKFIRHRRLQAPEHLSWQSFRKGMLVCHQAFYANTKIAKQTPFNPRYLYSADVDWCIRIMKEGKHQGLDTLNVHRVLANYLEGGMSIKNHRASLLERYQIMQNHYGFIDTLWLHFTFIFRALLKK